MGLSNHTPSVSSATSNASQKENRLDSLKHRLTLAKSKRMTPLNHSSLSITTRSTPTPLNQYLNKSLGRNSPKPDTLLFHYTAGQIRPKSAQLDYAGPIAPYLKPKQPPLSTPLCSSHYRVSSGERCLGQSLCVDSSGKSGQQSQLLHLTSLQLVIAMALYLTTLSKWITSMNQQFTSPLNVVFKATRILYQVYSNQIC
ncbi:hypothetical protein GEMRC1_011535 [Eukaryota sp. GEM-RC1]